MIPTPQQLEQLSPVATFHAVDVSPTPPATPLLLVLPILLAPL